MRSALQKKLPWPIPEQGYVEEVSRWHHLPTSRRHREWHWIYCVRVTVDHLNLSSNPRICWVQISAYRYQQFAKGHTFRFEPYHKLEDGMEISADLKEIPAEFLALFNKVKTALKTKSELDESSYERKQIE